MVGKPEEGRGRIHQSSAYRRKSESGCEIPVVGKVSFGCDVYTESCPCPFVANIIHVGAEPGYHGRKIQAVPVILG
jgi:hypothetical protein